MHHQSNLHPQHNPYQRTLLSNHFHHQLSHPLHLPNHWIPTPTISFLQPYVAPGHHQSPPLLLHLNPMHHPPLLHPHNIPHNNHLHNSLNHSQPHLHQKLLSTPSNRRQHPSHHHLRHNNLHHTTQHHPHHPLRHSNQLHTAQHNQLQTAQHNQMQPTNFLHMNRNQKKSRQTQTPQIHQFSAHHLTLNWGHPVTGQKALKDGGTPPPMAGYT